MNLKYFNLNHRVHFYKTYTKKVGEDTFWLEEVRIFRKDGEPESLYFFTPTGEERFKNLFKYDERGNCIEDVMLSNEKETEKWVHIHNKQNQHIKSYYYENGELDDYYVYRFNAKGQCIEDLQFNAQDELITRTLYVFDVKGNEVVESNYDKFEEVIDKTTKIFTPDNKPQNVETLYYQDKHNSKLIIDRFYENGKLKKEESRFFDLEGKCSTEYLELYNEQEDLFKNETKHNHSPKEVRNYEYEYDTFGNWIKRIQYLNGELVEVEKREITYFE